jgi:hypothetical protein
MMQLSRRSLITGLVSFVAAPAIVRVSSIMPVKAWAPYSDEIVLKYLASKYRRIYAHHFAGYRLYEAFGELVMETIPPEQFYVSPETV